MTSPWYRAALVAFERKCQCRTCQVAPFWEANEWSRALASLGSSLRDGGMLCAAYVAGRDLGTRGPDGKVQTWTPGCQRPMPGWEE